MHTQNSTQRTSRHHHFAELNTVTYAKGAPAPGLNGQVDATSQTASQKMAQTAAQKMAPKDFDAVIQAICRDAATNTKDYLLRSNTGHDGE